MFGWLFLAAKKRRTATQSNFLPACDFSLQTFTHRARFLPRKCLRFKNSLVGKASKNFLFSSTSRLMET